MDKMRLCPLNQFSVCAGEQCPLFNIRMDTCVLPRLVLSLAKAGEALVDYLENSVEYLENEGGK